MKTRQCQYFFSLRMWKLQWIFLSILLIVLFVTLFNILSYPNFGKKYHGERKTLSFSNYIQSDIRTFRLNLNSSPESDLQLELDKGVPEHENVALEVIDKTEEKKVVANEPDAAEDVNSNERETWVEVSGAYRKDIKEKLEVEKSFHQLPLQQQETVQDDNSDSRIFWNFTSFDGSEIDRMSNLGRRLFLGENIGYKQNKVFTILVWKYGPYLERRLFKKFKNIKSDPFEKCSVNNCNITYDEKALSFADAVLFHFHRIKEPPFNLTRTNFHQKWVWLTDESPRHTFMLAKNKDISSYNNFFNWSMNYRFDADVPVPYGRTVPVTSSDDWVNLNIFDTKEKLVAIMGSNCKGENKRWEYVKELKKYIQVDIYGKCGDLKCPGYFKEDCSKLNPYMFYLAFENSDCDHYITEKVWWNAFGKNAVPVVMGGARKYYEKLFPPYSFIHVNDFNSPRELAEYLIYLSANMTQYNKYHKWRARFKTLNEHGYFGADVFHYCRLCEALNYNSPDKKTYSHLKEFWNVKKDCHPPAWYSKLHKEM